MFLSCVNIIWYLLSVYHAGSCKIFVPKYKDDESQFVKAQHEPLISEYLFETVQDILDGRKRTYLPKIISKPTLPLRGFLKCPTCSKILSGSISKGRNEYYSYYHCYNGCNFRLRADDLNNQFQNELKRFTPREDVTEMFKTSVHDIWLSQTSHLLDERTQINQQIREIKEKVAYMVELVSSKKIDPEDFMDSKASNARKLAILNGKLDELNLQKIDIEELLDNGLNNLLKLEYAYSIGDVDKKREIVGVVFPDKMEIENGVLRTGRVNEVMKYIYLMDNELSGKKKDRSKINLICPA